MSWCYDQKNWDLLKRETPSYEELGEGLMSAVYSMDINLFKALLDKGADIFYTDSNQNNLLLWSLQVSNAALRIIDIILENPKFKENYVAGKIFLTLGPDKLNAFQYCLAVGHMEPAQKFVEYVNDISTLLRFEKNLKQKKSEQAAPQFPEYPHLVQTLKDKIKVLSEKQKIEKALGPKASTIQKNSLLKI